jgi:hypothetical protein
MSLLDDSDPAFGIHGLRAVETEKPWIWTAVEVSNCITEAAKQAFFKAENWIKENDPERPIKT